MIFTLFKKELIDSLRDRRTLIMMLLVPVVLYPGMMLLVGTVMAAGKEKLSREVIPIGVLGDDAEKFLEAAKLSPNSPRVPTTLNDGAEKMREKQLWALVDAPDGAWGGLLSKKQATVTVRYTKRHDRSIEAYDRIRKALDALGKEHLSLRLAEAELPTEFVEPVKMNAIDVDFDKDLGPLIASRVLPVLLLVMLFMGALYPAIDVTAGEKERGTLETLLVAPVRPLQVMFAKYLTVTLISVLASVANLAAMGVTFAFGISLDSGLKASMNLSMGQLLTLFACFVPAALTASGVSLAVGSLARSFKEAQSLLTPVTLVAIVPGMLALMPGIELNTWTALVPLLNIALLVKAVILGAAQPLHVVLTLLSLSALALFSLKMAANAFQSEALRFGGAESWKSLFVPAVRR